MQDKFPSQAKIYACTNNWLLQFWKGVDFFKYIPHWGLHIFWTKIIIRSKTFLILFILSIKFNITVKRKPFQIPKQKENNGYCSQIILPSHWLPCHTILRNPLGELDSPNHPVWECSVSKFTRRIEWECWLHVKHWEWSNALYTQIHAYPYTTLHPFHSHTQPER